MRTGSGGPSHSCSTERSVPDEADLPSSYALEANRVRSARTQLSGRLVFLFLDQPAGELVQRQLTVSGLFDTSGRPMPSQSAPLRSRMVPPEAAGAIVSGRVLDALGNPIEGAHVIYRNTTLELDAILGVAEQFTGPEGTFQFDWVRKVANAAFRIEAMDPSNGDFQERRTTVRGNGERIVIDLVMRGRGGVRGVVSDLHGQPVPGARVLVTSDVEFGSYDLVETDGAGTLYGDRHRRRARQRQSRLGSDVRPGRRPLAARGHLRDRRRHDQRRRGPGRDPCARHGWCGRHDTDPRDWRPSI